MNKIIILTLLTILYLFTKNAYSQTNIGGKPFGYKSNINKKKITKNKAVEFLLPDLDYKKIAEEDSIDNIKGAPPRFGIPHKTYLTLENSGQWTELENGDRIWNLFIKSESAKSINLLYDEFFLPIGATFYIYNSSKSQHIGGFTFKNNKGTQEHPGKFGTGLVYGQNIVLEYYEPREVRNQGIISIMYIIQGYSYINIGSEINFGDGPICNVNVNCSPEGDNWQDEKTSVAMIIVNGHRLCTGSLINNVNQNGIPYFLTANHCITYSGLPFLGSSVKDAINNPDASEWSFYWNYESPNCANGTDFIPPSTTGATVVANNSTSDFALLRLHESPYDLTPQIQTYFNGWDLQTTSNNAVGIHHPAGDIKKISTENDPPTLFTNSWVVNWDSTTNGNSATSGGSSGSPLYNSNSRVIGQAWAAVTDVCVNQYTSYGRFDVSWNNGSEARRRLREWLDPSNTGVNFLDGTYCIGTVYFTNTNIDSDTTINGCTLNMQNVKVRNNATVTFDAVYDVIINREFEVELGSEIEIK